MAVEWLGFCAFIAKDLGSIPSWGTKIPQAEHQKIKNNKKKISGLNMTG